MEYWRDWAALAAIAVIVIILVFAPADEDSDPPWSWIEPIVWNITCPSVYDGCIGYIKSDGSAFCIIAYDDLEFQGSPNGREYFLISCREAG